MGPHGVPGVLFDVVSVQDVRAHFSFTFRRRFDRAQCRSNSSGERQGAASEVAPSDNTSSRYFLQWLSSPRHA